MRKRSLKNQKYHQRYLYRLTPYLMIENPICKVCGKANSQQIHHMNGREAWREVVEEWWLAVCYPCHDRITKDRIWAEDNGYIYSRNKVINSVPFEEESRLRNYYEDLLNNEAA